MFPWPNNAGVGAFKKHQASSHSNGLENSGGHLVHVDQVVVPLQEARVYGFEIGIRMFLEVALNCRFENTVKVKDIGAAFGAEDSAAIADELRPRRSVNARFFGDIDIGRYAPLCAYMLHALTDEKLLLGQAPVAVGNGSAPVRVRPTSRSAEDCSVARERSARRPKIPHIFFQPLPKSRFSGCLSTDLIDSGIFNHI